MKILGIMWEENSTAALMIDGEIIACVSQERFSRIKNDERYPKEAIEYVLEEGGVKPKDLNAVAFTGTIWKPDYILTRRYSMGTVDDAIREQEEYWYPKLYTDKAPQYLAVFQDKLDFNQYPHDWDPVVNYLTQGDPQESAEYFQNFRKMTVANHLGIDPNLVYFVDHHTAHAHYAYFASPIRGNTLVLTADAWGDDINATVSIAEEGKLTRIYECDDFILGRLYRYITLLLNMKPNEHEYKVMGLAPYAKEAYIQKALGVFRETQYAQDLGFAYSIRPRDLYFYFRERLKGIRFDAIAGALQRYTEELLTSWVKNICAKTKLRTVCFAGGTAMNIKAIMEINKLDCIDEIFVCPSPGDESQAMGSCYAYAAREYRRQFKNCNEALKPLSNAYLGPDAGELDCENTVKAYNDKYYEVMRQPDVATIAKIIAHNKVIGRAIGRSEFGARALGNRSILANPQEFDMIERINEAIKNRDFWMPFALTVIDYKAHSYLEEVTKHGSPYMTHAYETNPHIRRRIKAGIHPRDKTSRPQILSESHNPQYFQLLQEFNDVSDTGALLNTSFNLHGEPIVQSANDAFRVFELSGIDGLWLKDMLILKKSKKL